MSEFAIDQEFRLRLNEPEKERPEALVWLAVKFRIEHDEHVIKAGTDRLLVLNSADMREVMELILKEDGRVSIRHSVAVDWLIDEVPGFYVLLTDVAVEESNGLWPKIITSMDRTDNLLTALIGKNVAHKPAWSAVPHSGNKTMDDVLAEH